METHDGDTSSSDDDMWYESMVTAACSRLDDPLQHGYLLHNKIKEYNEDEYYDKINEIGIQNDNKYISEENSCIWNMIKDYSLSDSNSIKLSNDSFYRSHKEEEDKIINKSIQFEARSQLRSVMASYKKDFPSIAISVVENHNILFQEGIGLPGNIYTTSFSLASITKTFLAVLCIQTVEIGKFDLDEDINKYLNLINIRVVNPFFPNDSITGRHLLTHVSGLRDEERALETGSRWRVDGEDYPLSLQEYVTSRLCEGGESYQSEIWTDTASSGSCDYHSSNAGYTLLGLVLEIATNMSLSALAQQNIFSPLRMTHTSYMLSDLQSRDDVHLALPTRLSGEVVRPYGVAEWPAVQLRSSLVDMTKYMQAFLPHTEYSAAHSSGKVPLLSHNAMQHMFPSDMRQGLAWWGKDATYGDKSGRHWSHGGYMDGVRTHVYLWPREKVGAVILTNGEGDYSLMVKAIKKGCGII